MNHLCSFCTKPKKDVRWLVLGPEIKIAQTTLFQVSICDECTDLAAEIVAEERAKKKKRKISSDFVADDKILNEMNAHEHQAP